MIREHHKFLVWIRVIFDVFITAAAWLFAYYIRFKAIGGGQANLGVFFIRILPVVILINIFSIYKSGLYPSQRFIKWQKELFNAIIASIMSFCLIVMFSYFIMNLIISRLTLGIFLSLNTVSLILIRIIFRNILSTVRKKGKNIRYVVAVGFGDRLEDYIDSIKNNSAYGIIIKDVINPLTEDFDILKVLENRSIDQIAISIPEGHDLLEASILKACSNQLVPVVVIANIPYSFIGSNIFDFHGLPILEFNNPGIGLANRWVKRVIDILGSLFGLIVLSPVYLILALLVKVTSKGPIFYGQERMTREGKVFKMWKFRSMKVNAENIGSGWTVKDDPRRTVIGPFLRSSSLDELPQLWNVFIGQMSLVGPRPERPIFIDKFKDEIPAYMLRHKMKAGITGWAQVNGWRGDTSIPKRIECDLYYIKNWSIFMDIKILFLTFVKGFINKNAY